MAPDLSTLPQRSAAPVARGVVAERSGRAKGGGPAAAAIPTADLAAVPGGITTASLGRRVAWLGVFVALIALLVATLPGAGELRARFAGADGSWIGLALVLELGSVLAFVVAYRSVFCRRLPWRFSYQVGVAAQGTNVLLPTGGAGGLALGAWALQRAGMDGRYVARRSVTFFLVTSLVNFAVAVVVGPAVALGLLPGEAPLALLLVPSSLAALTLGAVVLLPRVVKPGGTGRLARARTALGGGVEDAIALVKAGRRDVIGGAVGYMFFDLLALAAAFHAFGVTPAAGTFALAYVIGQLGGLIPLPGGFGGTDGGLVAAFVLVGTPAGAAAAAVLAYRAFQLGLPALLGMAAFRGVQRALTHGAHAPAAVCQPALA